jgi:hypothetical protein
MRNPLGVQVDPDAAAPQRAGEFVDGIGQPRAGQVRWVDFDDQATQGRRRAGEGLDRLSGHRPHRGLDRGLQGGQGVDRSAEILDRAVARRVGHSASVTGHLDGPSRIILFAPRGFPDPAIEGVVQNHSAGSLGMNT